MLTQERKAHIRAVLRRDGRIVAKTLSQELDLSEDTIRRDLRELAAEGLLQRVHGGALPASPAMADYPARQAVAAGSKRAIAHAAAEMISAWAGGVPGWRDHSRGGRPRAVADAGGNDRDAQPKRRNRTGCASTRRG